MAPSYPLIGRAADAVLFRHSGGVVTAAGFLAAAEDLAARLPPGAPVIDLCRDRAAFAVAFAAALLADSVSLLAGERSPERLRSLAEAHPGAVTLSEDATPPGPMPHRRVCPDWSGTPVGPMRWLPAERLAAIVFTSGSTGEPVAHCKRWGALAVRSMAAAAQFGLDPWRPAEVLATVPPQHMYGFETSVLLPLHAPAASWSGAAFYPDDVRMALAALPAPVLLVTTPLQLRALLDAPVTAGGDGPAGVISATAPLDPALAARAEEHWGCWVQEIFGATEVGSIASRRTTAEQAWTLYPGLELAEEEQGATVAGPFAPPTPLADRVALLPRRRFHLLGRSSDLVKLGGRRASLSGLTRILAAIPGVEDGVFLAPDDLEARPSARLMVLAVAPRRSAEEILAELRPRVDPVFLPRRVQLVAALPRNELGKLPRAALLALATGARDG